MILRLVSGSVTPASASRKRFCASTTLRSTPVAATKSRSTCSASPLRSRPWSTKTQVRRSPIARWTSAAATAESTPPDSPQTARDVPTFATIAATASDDDVDHRPGRADARDLVEEPLEHGLAVRGVDHLGVVLDAGEPPVEALERGDRGAPEDARTSKPGGASCTASPWLIHTVWSVGSPASRVPPAPSRSAASRRTPTGRCAPPSRRARPPSPGSRSRCPGRGSRSSNSAGSTRGAPVGVDGRRPAREHDRARAPGDDLGHRHRVRDDLGVHPRLAHPPGDQLGVLRAVVDDQDGVVPVEVVRSRTRFVGHAASFPQPS